MYYFSYLFYSFYQIHKTFQQQKVSSIFNLIINNKDFVNLIHLINKTTNFKIKTKRPSNFTFHNRFYFSDIKDKFPCCDMNKDENYNVCPDKFYWKGHKNLML